MQSYANLGARNICEQLGYTKDQISILGKLSSLQNARDVAEVNVKLQRARHGTRTMSIDVLFDSALDDFSSIGFESKVRSLLHTCNLKLPQDGFTQYPHADYQLGLQYEGVKVRFDVIPRSYGAGADRD